MAVHLTQWDSVESTRQNSKRIAISNVSKALNRNWITHLASWYDQKSIPEYFISEPINLDEFLRYFSEYKMTPNVFLSASQASDFIKDNSMFATDTFVINPPWTEIFVVYRLWNIQYFQDLLKLASKGSKVEDIISSRDPQWSGTKEGHMLSEPLINLKGYYLK